jgi:hypothetical protein
VSANETPLVTPVSIVVIECSWNVD